VAGDGPQRAELEAMRPPHCDLVGPVQHKDLPALLRRADVVLVPSVHEKGVEEATSIAALEAMACARPVVASSIGGLKELLRDGENGLLVPERDADAIAAAVRRLVDDPALARRLGEQARADVLARFSLQARTEDYLRVVEKAVRRG
jgi:glycosyltransferase involved in cell wall biosynthesis